MSSTSNPGANGGVRRAPAPSASYACCCESAEAERPTGDKRQLRVTLLRRLKRQKEDDRLRKSAAIRRRLYRLAVFRRAKTVLCYVSLPYEVETRQLIEQMVRRGKRVVVPRVRGTHLELAELRDPRRQLGPGAFGVLEPVRETGTHQPVPPRALDVALVPGLAFDRCGQRLGHGHGYFDRLLARLPGTTTTVGMCFDFQLLDRLPADPHDQAVHTVLVA